MKKLFQFLAISLLGLGLGACNIVGPESYEDADFIGRWQTASEADDATAAEHLVYVFQSQQASGDSYTGRWGYSYDEGDDVSDDDLQASLHGNGWFVWHVEGNQLKTVEMMTASTAVVPYDYTIVSLTESELVLTHGTNTWKLTRVE